MNDDDTIRFEITGCAAHSRITPLLPPHWIDKSPSAAAEITTHDDDTNATIDFLWENAPRCETKSFRDHVTCYSHLPNGTAVLDDKWVLARFFSNNLLPNVKQKSNLLATLPSYCFRGCTGFQSVCHRVGLTKQQQHVTVSSAEPTDTESTCCFPDLADTNRGDVVDSHFPDTIFKPRPNLWVIKDAQSNGAGGIWIVGPENAAVFTKPTTTPLMQDHRYVAQQYAWPPVLYHGRKCHVRVYGLLTAHGQAFVHKRAFLHVANETFDCNPDENINNNMFEDCIHITNCCANSHDESKFSGEICADLEATEWYRTTQEGKDPSAAAAAVDVVPLGDFFPSIQASVAAWAEQALPFLRGGQANGGFEYLGIDFILSYSDIQEPIAYLLEVNAPPSQDTATGLKHAEDLHDQVLRDLLSLVVFPKLTGTDPIPGGWRCVHDEQHDGARASTEQVSETIVPSKASILNRIRLAIFERKASRLCIEMEDIANKEETGAGTENDAFEPIAFGKNITSTQVQSLTPDMVSEFARSRFPYYCCDDSVGRHPRDGKENSGTSAVTAAPSREHQQQPIFFENAGGSQVPFSVIQAVTSSLAHRNRSVLGHKTKDLARRTLLQLVGGDPEDHSMFLGSNASTLFDMLARQYVTLGALTTDDEVIISTENHLANTEPWISAASLVGAAIKWWTCTDTKKRTSAGGDILSSNNLHELLTRKTRIVALSHSSNILGQLRNLCRTCQLVRKETCGRAHVVADGVSAAPHVFPAVSELGVHWYGVSCHKMFGPHLGGLCGKRSVLNQLIRMGDGAEFDAGDPYKLLEIGTINYEACAGILGLAEYLKELASKKRHVLVSSTKPVLDRQTRNQSTESERDKDEDIDCGQEATSFDNVSHMISHHDEVSLTVDQIKEAYRRIRLVEVPLVALLLRRLRQCRHVRILEATAKDSLWTGCLLRLPLVGFVHDKILPSTIVEYCDRHGIACRHGMFLCTEHLKQDFSLKKTDHCVQESLASVAVRTAYKDMEEGLVRVSLAHYNTAQEVTYLMDKLESIPNWW